MTQLSLFQTLLAWLKRTAASAAPKTVARKPAPVRFPAADKSASSLSPVSEASSAVAWGAKVSPAFKQKLIAIARRLEMDPNHLMAVIAFETGRSFDPAIVNRAGSGATGLIQFMPATAKALGATTRKLAAMGALEQLDYVEAYLRPYAGRMKDVSSAYMAVLYPRAVGKPDDHVLFRKGSRAYKQNRGLDVNGNGHVTKAEASERVAALLAEGLSPGRIG